MKKWIQAATKGDVLYHIESGFRAAGAPVKEFLTKAADYCRVKLQLPNNTTTTLTVWYDYSKVPGAPKMKVKYDPWQQGYSVTSSGDVVDSQGQIIGKACVEVQVNTTSTIRDYNLDSIRTNSGDIIIDHPEKSNTYRDVVNSLMTRKVTHSS